jgi:hypothetical protein
VALIIRLSCDKCEGESLTVTIGTSTDARVDAFKYGWYCTGKEDLCPVCMGKNPDYYTAEPF